MRYELYRDFILRNVPRLLAQLDRDKNSPTYGCFDRNYWHYKIRDFPSMIVQQGSLSLALLHSNNFRGNVYHKNRKIKDWTIASMNFWKENQLKDGSFNEYYPNEHGYPPTVFTLYTTSETYRILKKAGLTRDDGIVDHLTKAARFVSIKEEEGALNQEMASITALYSTYLATKEKWILDSAERKLKNILRKQTKEGWFSEYGGADIGYLSVSLDFLAEYYKISGDKSVLPHLKRILDFVKFFVHPNNAIGGEYGSRNTQYFLPNGLEILSKKYKIAGVIADRLLGNPNSIYLSIDERYVSHYFLHSFVRAFLNCSEQTGKLKLPNEIKTRKYFEESGLYVLNGKNYYSVLNLSKGGVLKAFGGKNEIINDCGYLVRKNRETFYVTNWLGSDYRKKRNGDALSVSGNFHLVRYYTPSQIKHIALRAGSKMMGKRVIPMLKKRLITGEVKVPIKFHREVRFLENDIIIKDVIRSNKKIKKLYAVDRSSFRYVPSSKYFQISDIEGSSDENVYENVTNIEIVKRLNVAKNKLSVSSAEL